MLKFDSFFQHWQWRCRRSHRWGPWSGLRGRCFRNPLDSFSDVGSPLKAGRRLTSIAPEMAFHQSMICSAQCFRGPGEGSGSEEGCLKREIEIEMHRDGIGDRSLIIE